MKAIKTKRKIVIFYKMPNKFQGHKLKDLTKQEIYNIGFRDVIAPKIEEGFKLGKIYFNEEEDYFTYNVLKKTIFEKDNEEKEDEDKKEKSKIKNGSGYYNKAKKKLYKNLKKGKLTQNQFNKLYTPVRKALIWCNTGDFDIALEEVQKLSFTNQKLQNEINKITEFLDEQIIEINYKR